MNILILSVYPIENPMHGGQLRVKAMVDYYQKQGHKVTVSGVLASSVDNGSRGFINAPSVDKFSEIARDFSLIEDYCLSQLGKTNQFDLKLLGKAGGHFDYIQIEHPWLIYIAKRIRDSNFPQAKIIYSSHNVESDLKFSIVSKHRSIRVACELRDKIKKVELDAINYSDYIIAVSKDDVDWINSEIIENHYERKKIFLCPNSVSSWDKNYFDSRLSEIKYAVFFGSSYPPNSEGYFEMLGGGLGALRPSEHLFAVGGVCDLLGQDSRMYSSAKLAERTRLIGLVSERQKHALINSAHSVILPIREGGGSNLKTAEAIWSGKWVVGTSKAFRGYEEYMGDEGIIIADSPAEFKAAIRITFDKPPLMLSDSSFLKRNNVLWERNLDDLQELLN